DPNSFYIRGGTGLYRLNVTTNQGTLLKDFASVGGLSPSGPSVNQAGDRIFTGTSDGVRRSFHLPDMSDERAFAPQSTIFPAGCVDIDPGKDRYVGFQNYIVLDCSFDLTGHSYIVNDNGAVFTDSTQVSFGGHVGFSGTGKVMYIKLPILPDRNDPNPA